MKKMLNSIFMVLKFILLILAFGFSLFIILSMYKRIEKNIIDAIPIFIPYVIILLLFFINVTMNQKSVNNNIFYNLTCCLVFFSICFVGIRAVYDDNMVLNEIMGYNINFSYFSDFIVFMKMMIYGLIVSNVCFMIRIKGEERSEVARKIEVI